MQTVQISAISDQYAESIQPTSAPALELPPSTLPTIHQPDWLLALMVLTILANRLYQVLVAAMCLLREWRKGNNSKSK